MSMIGTAVWREESGGMVQKRWGIAEAVLDALGDSEHAVKGGRRRKA